MSDPLRIALVAEGPTDKIVVQAAIAQMLGERSFVLRQLQPEESLAFGPLGTGWPGVYHWCQQAAKRAGGLLRNDPLFATYDVLVLHLDADVADKNYEEAGIKQVAEDLPCAEPCPPPWSTTNRLRKVLLRWAGEDETPLRTVLCTPSKSTEAWILAALYSRDRAVIGGGLECWANPEARLGQQPKASRIQKTIPHYQGLAPNFQQAWPTVSNCCSEAKRFSEDFLSAIMSLSDQNS